MNFDCPCCGYRTLTSRYETDTCFLCLWEDDLVSDLNQYEVVGGPNDDYSLSEARENFIKYLVMYRPSDPRFLIYKSDIIDSKKKTVICIYDQLNETMDVVKKRTLIEEIKKYKKEIKEEINKNWNKYNVS